MEKIVVLLMAMNEEKAMPSVLEGLGRAGIGEIVVVDGHSTDATAEIAREAGCIVIMQEGEGKGMAFQTFLKKHPLEADAAYVMLDADASYDPADVPRLAGMLGEFAVVTGHRTTIHMNPKDLAHFIGNKLISFLGLLLFGRWNPDICTGYWAFRGSALKEMRIRAARFDLEADFFAQGCKLGLSMGRASINYYQRVGERKLRSRDALQIIWRLFMERFSA